MNEKVLLNKIAEQDDLIHRLRLEKRGLQRKLDRKNTQSALFVKHTLKIFEMCGIDWRDVVRLYDYCIEQESVKKDDTDSEECC